MVTRLFKESSRPPRYPEMHYWADWVEMMSLTAESLSCGDAVTRLVGGIKSEPERVAEDESASDAVRSQGRRRVAGGRRAPLGKRPRKRSARETDGDTAVRKADAIFELLEARSVAYGESYPFIYDSDGRTITKRQEFTNIHLLYVFLLRASLLAYCPNKRIQSGITGEFEVVCCEALKRLVPESAEVHIFGKSAQLEKRYPDLLRERVEKLAKDLRAKVILDNLKLEFEDTDYGDNGLDLVAWVPMDDPAAGMSTALAQCACTDDWVQKQHSSSEEAWKSVLHFEVSPINYCFIPFDFRRVDDNWTKARFVHNSVLIDRRRLMALLGRGQPARAEEAFGDGSPVQARFEEIRSGLGAPDPDL